MKSTVQALALLTSAVSAALGQALVGLSEDPLLVWNYGSVAVIAMIGGIGFYMTFRNADKNEDAMNNQKESNFLGENEGGVVAADSSRDGKSLDEEKSLEKKATV
jgi:proton-dependent oligopeptide transporter, POT family